MQFVSYEAAKASLREKKEQRRAAINQTFLLQTPQFERCLRAEMKTVWEQKESRRPQFEPVQKSVYERANWWMRNSLSFVITFIRLSLKNNLKEEDLGPCPSRHEASKLGTRLESYYDEELQKYGTEKGNFFRAMCKMFVSELVFIWLLNLMARAILFPLQTIALGWIVRDFRHYEQLTAMKDELLLDNGYLLHKAATANYSEISIQHKNELDELMAKRGAVHQSILIDTAIFLVSLFIQTSINNSFWNTTWKIGMRARVAACNLIYKKSLKLSQSALGQGSTSTGQMVNLLSNDVVRFDGAFHFIVFLWDGPIHGLITLFILSQYYLGFYASGSGLLVILLMMCFQTYVGKWYSKMKLQVSVEIDKRSRLLNEIIQAIRVIKMYAWEVEFKRQVAMVREAELKAIRRFFFVRAISLTTYFIASKIIVFVMLMVYLVLDIGPLSAEIIFVTMGMAALLRMTIGEFFGLGISTTAEVLVSCSRIHKFLQLPEIDRGFEATNVLVSRRQSLRYKLSFGSQKSSSIAYVNLGETITFDRFYANWTPLGDTTTINKESKDNKTDQMVLRNLSFSINCNELVLIVGRVGSGKSSLLLAILNELPKASGRLQVNGQVSYASQEPWLFSGTIEENILFGKQRYEPRYNEVVRVCCLERDLELFGSGDQTLVGERGVSLSGGQKARINLARALYQEAEIYLLDDPLSAVDAPVARHIFGECLRRPSGFLADKTCLVATHQLQFLHEADKILLLHSKEPPLFGTPDEILHSNAFKSIGYIKQTSSSGSKTPAIEIGSITKENAATDTKQSTSLEKNVSKVDLDNNAVGQVAVSGKTYLFYLSNAFTFGTAALGLATLLVAQALYQCIDYALGRWSDSLEHDPTIAETSHHIRSSFFDIQDVSMLVLYYSLMVIVCIITILFTSFIIMVVTIRASRKMHAKSIENLINTKLAFYEKTPIGVLLNRLTRDFGYVDQKFPCDVMYLVTSVGNCVGMIVLSCLLAPQNIFMVLLLLGASLVMRRLCVGTIARLKQLESIAQSPLFNHLTTTLGGLATIRSHRVESQFESVFVQYQNHHTAGYFNYIMCYRWVSIVMYWFCAGFVAFVSIYATVFLLDDSSITAGLLGLLITQAIMLPPPYQQVTRELIQAESEMTSVERIRQLSEDLEVEEPHDSKAHLDDSKLDLDNMKGSIEFERVSLHYESSDRPVLNELTLKIGAGEKIGIVGRTGAGKSSIVSVLFRLYDFEGRIELDGVDTKSLSLGRLRKSMSIIPQDPILFGGSLRKNLDPFGEHSDEQLWGALEAVQLRQIFVSHPAGLEFQIQEGGANFSVGQRQLVCLARAIVRRNKLLLLDEATANVDPETDAFIQRTIARQFAHCTVLTIAHRLITIVDSDRVLVLDGGQVSEFGAPFELLQNPSGLFAQMVESSAQQAPRIKKLIEEAHQRRTAPSPASDRSNTTTTSIETLTQPQDTDTVQKTKD